MSNILNKFKSLKSEFVSNVLLVMTGTAASQIIALAVTPILTRNYSPDDFGFLLIYLSILTIAGTCSTGKFERVFLLLKDEKDFKKIVFLSFTSSIIIALVLFALLFLFKSLILENLDIEKDLYVWLFSLPILIIIYAQFVVFGVILNYQKKYQKLSASKIIKTISAVTVSLIGIFVLNDARGLVLGEVSGYLFSTLYLIWPNRKFVLFDKLVFINLKGIVQKYKRFPIYNIPSDFMNMTSSQMPAFFLTSFFNAGITGFYSLMKRVLDAPVALLSSSVLEVFRQKAAMQYIETGSCRRLFVKTAINLAIISFLPFLILFLFAPELFSFVFGKEWFVAGQYARIFALYYYFKFISSPLSYMFFIAEKQKIDFILQSYLFISTLLVFNSPRYLEIDVFSLLWIYTLNLVLFYVILFYFSFRFTINKTFELLK